MSSVAEDVRAAAAEVGGRSAESAPEPTPVPVPPADSGTGNQSPEAAGTSGTTPGRDEHGRFTPKQGDKPAETTPPVPPKSPEAAKAPAEPPKSTPAATKRPPPQAWRPLVREHWDKLPPEVQEEIARIEVATSHAIRQKAEQAKGAERWQKVLEPYAPHIQGDPVQWADGIFRTAVQLQTAPQPQRAALMARLIQDFGVDVRELDNALTAGPNTGNGYSTPTPQQRQAPAIPDPNTYAAQVMAHIQNQMAVQAFEKEAEFLDEPMPSGQHTVRDMVAAYLEAADKTGIAMTLKQAYDAVVATHPTVSEALKQREAKANAERETARTAQAAAASSSVRSEPVVVAPEDSGGGSVWDDVRASAAMLRNQRR